MISKNGDNQSHARYCTFLYFLCQPLENSIVNWLHKWNEVESRRLQHTEKMTNCFDKLSTNS
ncbi:hypothetical protein M758_UG159100 [Ceratodon purpureus]|nr:hypothetical protein M758_UG098400 [Ceratodon purpureus]KAG0595140.1 hypothetical protein M758_UG143100 [Ceratodon purpureus]KAG0595343.1 hypothetical protein M758_UG159100 [Ceratodon purpureus]